MQSLVSVIHSFNTILQAEQPLIHVLCESVDTLYCQFLTRCVDPRKVTAAEEILKHAILDIELTEENLLSCVFIGFITKQNAIKEELIGTSKYKKFNFYITSLKYLRPSMSILKSMSLTFLHSS